MEVRPFHDHNYTFTTQSEAIRATCLHCYGESSWVPVTNPTYTNLSGYNVMDLKPEDYKRAQRKVLHHHHHSCIHHPLIVRLDELLNHLPGVKTL